MVILQIAFLIIFLYNICGMVLLFFIESNDRFNLDDKHSYIYLTLWPIALLVVIFTLTLHHGKILYAQISKKQA